MRYLILCILLAGCASKPWQHPTATPAQFNQDNYECHMQASAMYPAAMTSANFNQPAPVRTNCTAMGNTMNCTTQQQANQIPPVQYDQNQIARSNAQGQCLRARGYYTN